MKSVRVVPLTTSSTMLQWNESNLIFDHILIISMQLFQAFSVIYCWFLLYSQIRFALTMFVCKTTFDKSVLWTDRSQSDISSILPLPLLSSPQSQLLGARGQFNSTSGITLVMNRITIFIANQFHNGRTQIYEQENEDVPIWNLKKVSLPCKLVFSLTFQNPPISTT